MKYYGMMYHGNVNSYDLSKAIVRGSVYDALVDANRKWNANNDQREYRFLVVFKRDDNGNEPEENCNAYFQFLNTKSCTSFIQNRETIQWSNSGSQKWNGDAKLVG